MSPCVWKSLLNIVVKHEKSMPSKTFYVFEASELQLFFDVKNPILWFLKCNLHKKLFNVEYVIDIAANTQWRKNDFCLFFLLDKQA